MFTFYLWKNYFRIYKNNIDWVILVSLALTLPFELLVDFILLPLEIIVFIIILIIKIKEVVIN